MNLFSEGRQHNRSKPLVTKTDKTWALCYDQRQPSTSLTLIHLGFEVLVFSKCRSAKTAYFQRCYDTSSLRALTCTYTAWTPDGIKGLTEQTWLFPPPFFFFKGHQSKSMILENVHQSSQGCSLCFNLHYYYYYKTHVESLRLPSVKVHTPLQG